MTRPPVYGSQAVCWLAQFTAVPCDGPLVRAHLIPRQLLKRELLPSQADRAIADERSWVPACGGPTGIGGHHGMLDHSRTLRIGHVKLPPDTVAFARQLGLGWWLEREYGAA